jgi:hypothetical protein
MNLQFIFFLVVAITLVVGVTIGLSFLLPIIRRHLTGSSGGWGRLARAYPATQTPPAHFLDRQTVVAGRVIYRNCVRVGISDEGLFLELSSHFPVPKRPALLIPWNEFKHRDNARLYWQEAILLRLGDPLVGTITLPMNLFERIRPSLKSTFWLSE